MPAGRGRVLPTLVLVSLIAGACGQHRHVHHTTVAAVGWTQLTDGMSRMHASMSSLQPSGDDDVDFARLMLSHHEGAVEMAKAELLHGHDLQLRRLAQEIITDQQSEIQLMRLWLDRREVRERRGTP